MKIHPTAKVHPDAKIGKNVKIGSNCCVSGDVTIQDQTVLAENCIIKGNTTIGKRCKIFTGAVIGSAPQDLKYKGEKTSVLIGDNNIIREYVTINLGTVGKGQTKIGNNNLIMAYAHIAHDSEIGNDIVMANVGTLAGHVIVEDKAIIGGLVGIHQFVRVGKLSIIGGCSKVIQDAPPFSIFDGCPARVRGINSIGLRRAGYTQEQRIRLKTSFKKLFRGDLSFSNAIKSLETQALSEEEKYLINFIKNSKRGIGR